MKCVVCGGNFYYGYYLEPPESCWCEERISEEEWRWSDWKIVKLWLQFTICNMLCDLGWWFLPEKYQ